MCRLLEDMVLSNVIDFQTGEQVKEKEIYNVHDVAEDILSIIYKDFEYPDFVTASALMLIAHDLIKMNKIYLPCGLSFTKLANLIEKEYG